MLVSGTISGAIFFASANEVKQLERAIKLNTEIHAKTNKKLKNSKNTKVNIVAGAGEYNIKSKQLEPKRTNYNAPSFAIDTSQLGGLYAGKIRLISSEAGVGVNLPNIHSTTDNIEITADGKIIHKGISSAKKLEITSTSNKIIAATGRKAIAQGDVLYRARGGIELEDKSEIRSGSYIHLESLDGTLENKGNILSPGLRGIYIDANNVNNSGTILTTPKTLANIFINSRGSIKNSGKIKTDLELTTIAQNGFLNTGKIKSQKFKHYGDNFENAKDSKIHVQNESLFYLSQNFTNSGAINTKNLLVQSESGTLVNSGIIKAATPNFIGNKFENKNSGAIHIQNKALFTLNENFVNSGEIYSSGLEVLSKTGKTTNSGTIISATGASFDSYLEFINTGNIDASVFPLEITSRTQGLVNSGKIAAPKITISTKLDIKNNNLIQGNLLEITSTHSGLKNSGKITAPKIPLVTAEIEFAASILPLLVSLPLISNVILPLEIILDASSFIRAPRAISVISWPVSITPPSLEKSFSIVIFAAPEDFIVPEFDKPP